jgi:molybdopterin-guanine dinucleotide biosynthesis protein A
VRVGGLDPRELVGMLRDARSKAESTRPLVVDGVLARELARILSAGGDPAAVQVAGDPRRAAAYVVVLAGAAGEAQVERLRKATRAFVPVIAVQTSPTATTDVAYVPATEVLVCAPGQGFPLAAIADTLARLLDHDAVPLAAKLPALRPAVVARLVEHGSLRAGLAALLAARRRELFPLLVLQQLRLALDVAAASGQRLGRERAPELAAVVAAGFATRTAVRRLGLHGSALVGALSGYGLTRAIGELARRRGQG